LRSLYWPVVHSKGHAITLAKRDDLDAALHARPLLRQDELAAGEVLAWFREEDCHLNREGEIAVEVLVEAVEVARHVLQQQRRRARLAGIVAPLQERGMVVGVALADTHATVPVIRDVREMGIECRPQATQKVRKRILEVAILALAEAVPCHVDVAAEV